MNLSPNRLIYFSLIGLIVSFIIHLLAVMYIYLISTSGMMIVTAGILIVWLQTSKNLKSITRANEDQHPWKYIIANSPQWMHYLFYFLILYAFINFLLIMDFTTGSGFIDLNVSQPKLRGLSGFWLVFYMLGILSGHASKKQIYPEESSES